MKTSWIFGLLGLLWGCAPNPSSPGPQAASPAAAPAATAAPATTATPGVTETPAATPAPTGKAPAGKTVTSKSGLKHVVIKPGKGAVAKKGSHVYVHYTGVLENGTKFDSSRDRGVPIDFVLGTGRVIAGWDEGLEGMKVGEQRKLTIPPDLAYGDQGFGNVIPGGATLIFDVEMVKVE